MPSTEGGARKMPGWRNRVPTPLRRLAARVLPLPSRLDSPNVSDVRSLALAQGLRIDVYWLQLPEGQGPAASLRTKNDELMRFDCVGGRWGHFHLNLRQTRGFPAGGRARLYFSEQSIAEQIERSCFEMENNLVYALRTNQSARIRRLQIDPKEIETATQFFRREAAKLIDRRSTDS